MATTLFLSSYIQPLHRHLCQTTQFKSHKTPFLKPKQAHPLFIFPKSGRYNLILSSSTSSSSSCSTSSSSTFLDPIQTGRFLSNEEFEKLQFLHNFSYFQELKTGSMWVRVMREDEMDMTVGLLTESFAESVLVPNEFVNLLGILVKQHLVESRTSMPHTATLIGFYKGEGEEELAGTVEIIFNEMGGALGGIC